MTIVEMLAVCIIIGILASIAILTLINTRKHAIATEAIVGLSSLKQVMRHYYTEYGAYQNLNSFLNPNDTDPSHPTYPKGINPGFVNGAYFQDPCYKIDTGADRVYCYPAYSNNQNGQRLADGASDDSYIALNLTGPGNFSQRNVSSSCYKSE